MMFDCGLQNIFQLKSGQSRSINWENRNGEKGKGGMASSDLGPSRKVPVYPENRSRRDRNTW